MSSSAVPPNTVLIWLMLAWPGVGARKPVLNAPRRAKFGVTSKRPVSLPVVVLPNES
ncbi:hypothetical protein D3C71_608960 [compost metagenome]